MDLEEIKLSDQASDERTDTLGSHLREAPRAFTGRESRRRFTGAGRRGGDLVFNRDSLFCKIKSSRNVLGTSISSMQIQ